MQRPFPYTPNGSLCTARAGLAYALAFVLLGVAAPRLAAQTDNFNDGTDTSPVAWNHYSLPSIFAATYTFPADDTNGKAYKISAPPTVAPYGNARAGSFPLTPTYTNRFSIGTDLLNWSTAGRPNAGLLWYFHDVGLGTSDGYAATFAPSNRNIYISIVTNEAQAAYISRVDDGAITLFPTNRIRMTVSSHDGGTFVFSVYNLLEPSIPWASAVGADYTWYGYGGYSGYLVMNEDYPGANGASATFDNYSATEPAAGDMPAMLTDVYPPPAGRATAVHITNSVVILNRDTFVDPTSILLCLDGTWIPNASLTLDYQVNKQYNPGSFQKIFGGATASYAIPNLLPWGSRHTNVVVFSDSTTWFTNSWTWTVAYPYLFASNSLPVGSLNVRGFDVRMAQTTNGGVNLENSLDRARKQLAGLIPVDQRATSIVQVLNWNKTLAYPNNVPGLCPGVNAAPINIAAESCAYLQLTAGAHRFHITTDDRAGVYSGVNLGDASSPAVWEALGSTANTVFEFVVEADGLYPFRCLWEETGGSANLSLYSVDPDTLAEVLVNDGTDPSGVVKAWYPVVCKSASSVAGPYALAAAAEHTLSKSDLLGNDCGSAVVGQMVTGGTLKLPVSGLMQFYRLDTPRKTSITNITRTGSDIVITYQFL